MGKGHKSDSDDFSEEERQMRKKERDPKNSNDPKNKLNLGKFHRNNISKKVRKPSLKKQIIIVNQI
mgnify:CR=1 FL=1